MDKENAIKLFNDKKIRILWDDEREKWFFSIVDVIEVLTGSDRPRKYWSDLKRKLKEEGSQLSEKIGQLKMMAADGKYYKHKFMIFWFYSSNSINFCAATGTGTLLFVTIPKSLLGIFSFTFRIKTSLLASSFLM